MCFFISLHLSKAILGFCKSPFFGFSSNLTSLGEFVGFGWSLDTMRAQDEHRGFFGLKNQIASDPGLAQEANWGDVNALVGTMADQIVAGIC